MSNQYANKTKRPLPSFLAVSFFFLLLGFSTVSQAATWTVCASGCNYSTIASAISNASTVNGDTVMVYDGTWSEKVDFGSKVITVRSQNGAATTKIQGDNTNSPAVTFNNAALTSSAVLDGFTIDNQAAASTLTRGIYIASGATPTIQNVIVEGNALLSGNHGAGIYITAGSATILSSTLGGNAANKNTCTNGCGLYANALSSPLTVGNSTISENSGSAGAGIYLNSNGAQTTTITGCAFTNNYTSLSGGAIYSNGSKLIINGAGSFASNTTAAGQHGGAIYLTGAAASADISGATFTNNSSGSYGGAIYIINSTEATPLKINNCTFTNNGTAATKPQYGGAVALNTVTNASTISSTSITGSNATIRGGGIYATSAPVTLANVNVNSNAATQEGGGLYITGAASTLSITGGSVNGNAGTSGGGLYLNAVSAASTIDSASISNNTLSSATGNGGGVYTNSPLNISLTNINSNSGGYDGMGLYATGASAVVTLTGGTVNGNIGRHGAGIYLGFAGSLTLTGVSVNSNISSAAGNGGGIDAAGASFTIIRSEIKGNRGGSYGGGIYSGSTTGTIINSTISGNVIDQQTYSDGGGIYAATTTNIYNCTIAGNYARRNGGGLRVNAGTTTVQNTIIWGNTALSAGPSISGAPTVTYSDIAGGYAGAGNINIDPTLVDLQQAGGAAPTAAGNFHLAAGSPVIDQGVNNANTPVNDIDGDARPQSSGIDIGSDEYLVNTPPVGGYAADNVIPAAQVSQAVEGSGIITITWKGKDGENHTVTLKNFQYSVDGGATWNAPTNGDTSASLSANWNDNGGARWSTATTFGAAAAHSFTFNTKHVDVAGFNGVDQSDVQVRFTLNDGTVDSAAPVTSENLRVDDHTPTTTISSAVYDPATDIMTITGTDFTTIATAGTDIKTYVDWSKFVWDVNGDNATTANITFVLGDVTSLTVTNDTTLTLVFTGAKGTAIETTAGYGPLGGSDTLDVTAGYIKDYFGNTATTDSVADGVLSIDNMVSGVVYTDEGTTSIGAGKTVRLLVNGADAGTGVTDASGIYIINTVINPGDAVLVYIDNDVTYKGTTITMVNGTSPPSMDIYTGHVIVRHDNGGSLTNAVMGTAKGTYSDTDIYYSVSDGALTVSGSGAELYVPSGYTFSPGGNVTTLAMENKGVFNGGTGSITVTGALVISGGSYTATSGMTTVNGNLTLSVGAFSHNWGTVTLDGTSQSITGSFNFNNLTKIVGTAATITFGAGSTTTINGTVTLQGASGQLLSLVSSTPGTRWWFTLNLGAGKSISYVNVQDSDASGSDTSFRPIGPASSTNGGNNVDWFTLDTITAKAVLVYSSTAAPGALYPKNRKWSGGGWTVESTLPAVTSTSPKQVVVKTKPAGGNERVAAIRDQGNNLFLYSWQGGDWALRASGITLPANDLRSFDIAYEQVSKKAIIVYNTSAAAATLKYRIWDGTGWGSENSLPAIPTTATVAWVRLEAKPETNEILLAWVDNSSDLGAGVWNGSSWTINGTRLTLTTSTPNFQCFDVAHETATGKAIVAYIENAVATPKYYTYLNGTWTGPLVAPAFTEAGEYLRLVADPRAGSNKIIMGVGTDTGNWLQVDLWDGTSWDAAPITLSSQYSPYTYRGRAFDLAWESQTGRVMAVYGNGNSSAQRGQYRLWDGVTWAAGNWSAEANMPSGATRPQWVQLAADPGSNEIFTGISDEWTKDLNVHRWNGSMWLGRQEFSINVSTTAGENFMFSYRVDAPPSAAITAPANSESLAGTLYAVTGVASDDYGVYKVEVSIQRSGDNKYWTGGQWTASQTWLRADNATLWSYVWQLPSDYGAYTYTITARATDNLGQTATSTPVTGVRVYSIPQGLTVYRNTAVVDSSTQITATAEFTGDGDGDNSTLFETGPSAAGPWTSQGNLTTASPRTKAISGLTPGTVYYVRITHTDPDGVTGTNPAVIGPYSTKTDGTTVTAILATVDDCGQATVSAYYNNDGNANGSTAFHYSTDNSNWTAAPGCGALTGASPRQCVVTGLTASTTYFFRATFSDADGTSGANPIGTPNPSPYKTLATCLTRGSTTNVLSVDTSNCRQLTVRVPVAGDDDRDGSVLVEYKKSSDSTWSTACGGLAGATPRTCYVTGTFGLDASTTYDIRATYTDPDGVSGANPQTASAGTPACSGADIFPPTVTLFRPMDNSTVSGNATYPVRVEITAYDRHGLDISSVKAIVNGTEYVAAANPYISGNYYYDWTPSASGYHTIQARAGDNAGNVGYSSTYRVYVNSIATDSNGLFTGDGKLLVRENTSQFCADCHGGIQTHSSQNLSPKYGNWSFDCRTCHQPHNTANIFLLRPTINTPNSGAKSLDFRTTTGQADYSYATKTTPGNGPCEVCHTKTRNGDDSGRYRNTGTGPGPKGDSHFTDQRCTDCHKHTQGFSPISPGNVSCGTCHPDRWNAMNGNTNEYHMYMQNSNTTAIAGGIGSGNKYPSESQPEAESEHRRCLMCHADMDVWHYKNNPNSSGVAYNLRVSINVAPDKNDPTTYTNKDFDGTRADGGICFSCHSNQQTKNTAKIKDDGTTYSPGWDLDKFKAGTHNYSVPVTFKADNSTFNATCVKCHTDTMVKDYQSSAYRVGAHSGTTRSYLSNINKNATLVETTKNSLEENMCYQCHSMSTEGPDNYNPNGYNGVSGTGKDGYNVQNMTNKAQRLKFLFSKDSSHPIDGAPPYDTLNSLSTAAGRHRVDEGVNDAITPSGVQIANWNPAATRHVECMDCHNPHATNVTARDMITWRSNPYHPAGSSFSNYQMIEGSFGGQIGGANYGQWGVEPTYTTGSAWVAPTSFTKVQNMGSTNGMYQICFKCHSIYAYGNTKPQIPWGTSTYTAGTGDTWGNLSTSNFNWEPGQQSDLSIDFNPYNYAFHPILRRGRNQPAPHLNRNWPYFNGGAGNQAGGNWWVTSVAPGSSGTVNYNAATKVVTIAGGNNFPTYYMQPGWKIQFANTWPAVPTAGTDSTYYYEIKTVNSATQITLVSGPSSSLTGASYNISAGLGWAFVPPYGPWSTLACGDCHQSGDPVDPAGPHGSDNPWILREINYAAAADNDLNGSLADAVDYINTSTGDPNNPGTWTITTNLCFSCHRRDTYGNTAAGNASSGEPSHVTGSTAHTTYSRTGHTPGPEYTPSSNAFGIWCLNCHGGDSLGGIHGSNRDVGSSGTSVMGLRLRNGASSTGHNVEATGGNCWTKNTADNVTSCNTGHGGSAYGAYYNYIGVD